MRQGGGKMLQCLAQIVKDRSGDTRHAPDRHFSLG
jgi:hypothetical protein